LILSLLSFSFLLFEAENDIRKAAVSGSSAIKQPGQTEGGACSGKGHAHDRQKLLELRS